MCILIFLTIGGPEEGCFHFFFHLSFRLNFRFRFLLHPLPLSHPLLLEIEKVRQGGPMQR